jgi:outer membrane immunogenic protein
MKKFLVCAAVFGALGVTSAVAADLPTKAPVYKAPPAAVGYNWTGFYIGANAGYGWSDPSFILSADNGAGQALVGNFTPRSGSFRSSGFIGGGQLGYNWQFHRNWVAGIEADVDYAAVRSNGSFPVLYTLGPYRIDAGRSMDWFGTVRARLGVLPTERFLVFVTGGLAYGKTNTNASITNARGGNDFVAGTDGTLLTCVANTTCLAGTGSRTSAGWTVGGGVEYAFWNNFSLKAEYLYVNLGSQTIHLTTVPPSSGTGAVAASFNDAAFHIVRVGLNYRFGY